MGIVFFDMDKTLLDASSGALYVKYLWRRNMISTRELIGVMMISMQYSLNLLNFPRAMARLSQRIRGGDAAATKQLCDRWVEEDVLPHIAPKALARLRAHEQQGDCVVLLSASTQFAVEPVARHLRIPYRCTELEIVNGRFTGGIVGEPCYGEGKRIWGERIAAERGASLSQCTFYTDSYSDRALLDVVGHPVVVNPDRMLRRYARERSWPIEYFY
ncbi:MAG: HAD family hydrolase [Chloroflexi bacterium]|nr:MAG: HAD family hydrolase [Chloroflexota bacterium]